MTTWIIEREMRNLDPKCRMDCHLQAKRAEGPNDLDGPDIEDAGNCAHFRDIVLRQFAHAIEKISGFGLITEQ